MRGCGAAGAGARGKRGRVSSPPRAIPDDREPLDSRRASHSGRRGRRAVRADSARSRSRDGLPVRRGALGGGCVDRRRAVSARARFCSTSICRTSPGSACSISSSAILAPGISRCTWSSVADYRREALELGAVGYALKPAKREELVEALQPARAQAVAERATACSSSRMIRGSAKASASSSATATCRSPRWRAPARRCESSRRRPSIAWCSISTCRTCSGLRPAREDGAAGRGVVPAGHRLHGPRRSRGTRSSGCGRYSKSIIIKDARSPERLLDEVTLFLHQVESKLPPAHQQMLKAARNRDGSLEGRRILVVEDDVRNIFALTSVFEPNGAKVEIARNGREALEALARSTGSPCERHRPGAHGHHDARDGRTHRHARDPQATRSGRSCRSSRSPPRR